MFEGSFSPPFYNDLYNFVDGGQNDIFQDSYAVLPTPSPNASLPVLADLSGSTSSAGASATASASIIGTTSVLPVSIHTSTNANPVSTPVPSSSPNTNTKTWYVVLSLSLVFDYIISSTFHSKRLSTSSYLKSRSLSIKPFSILHLAKRSRKLDHGKRASLWHIF